MADDVDVLSTRGFQEEFGQLFVQNSIGVLFKWGEVEELQGPSIPVMLWTMLGLHNIEFLRLK